MDHEVVKVRIVRARSGTYAFGISAYPTRESEPVEDAYALPPVERDGTWADDITETQEFAKDTALEIARTFGERSIRDRGAGTVIVYLEGAEYFVIQEYHGRVVVRAGIDHPKSKVMRKV